MEVNKAKVNFMVKGFPFSTEQWNILCSKLEKTWGQNYADLLWKKVGTVTEEQFTSAPTKKFTSSF